MKRIVLLFVLMCLFVPLQLNAQKTYSNTAARLYNEAIGAYRQRQFTMAKSKFNEIITKHENDGYADIARIHLAQLYKDTKEYEKAINLYKIILETNVGMSDIHVARKELINLYYESHRYREGIDFIEELRKEKPLPEEFAIKLADFYMQTGRGDEGWLLLQSLLETNTSEKAFEKLLNISIKTGEIKKLMNILEARRLRYPEGSYVDFITSCHIALKENDKAIEILKNYKNINIDTELLHKLTRLLITMNYNEEAIKYLEKLVERNPNNWASVRSLGQCYLKQKQTSKAIETWNRPFKNKHMNRENMINLTDVLIESQLHEEAIRTIENYRRKTYDKTAFAVEKANILYATNRRSEAMEEYLLTFIGGIYKQEAFDKLYAESNKGFELKERLNKLNKTRGNRAITQALLEIYFKDIHLDDVHEISEVIKRAQGSLDSLFYDRFCQDISITEDPFYYKLLEKAAQARPNTSLELNLALKALEMTENFKKYANELYEIAKKVSNKNITIDLEKNAQLNIALANYALYKKCDPEESKFFLMKVLNSPLTSTYSKYVISSLFIITDCFIYTNKFDEANKSLSRVKNIIENDIHDNLEQNNYEAEHLLKAAYLDAHDKNYQGALTKLGEIIENYPETKHLNDALFQALKITQRSVGGSLETLDATFKAEKLIYTGKTSEAIKELKEIAEINTEIPSLLGEVKGDIILLKAKEKDPNELLEEINQYLEVFPSHHKGADILDLKISILLENKDKEKEALEAIKTFIEIFRSDFRVAKYKNLISQKGGF